MALIWRVIWYRLILYYNYILYLLWHVNIFKNQDMCAMQVGNALTDDYHDHLGVFQFLWSAGMISDQTFKLLNVLCDFQSFIHSSNSCDKILDIANDELGNVDPYSIFTPTCSANISQSNQLLKRRNVSMHILN